MSSVAQLTGFAFTSESAHMVHHPMWVDTVGSCIDFEEDSPGVFFQFFLQEEHSSNAGPTRVDQCLGV